MAASRQAYLYPTHLYSFYGPNFRHHEPLRKIENKIRRQIEEKNANSVAILYPEIRTLFHNWLFTTPHSEFPAFEWLSNDLCKTDRLFSNEFCEKLIAESIHLANSKHPHAQLNINGVDLLWFGFDTFFKNFCKFYLPKLIDELESSNKNWKIASNKEERWEIFHAFVIHYDSENLSENSHPVHVDDSEFTINVCLGSNPHSLPFEGGNLLLNDENGNILSEFSQKPLQTFFHKGDLIHSASPITKGERFNLILWFKRKNSNPSPMAAPEPLHFTEQMPDEVLLHILSYLSVPELCMVRAVSKKFHELATDNLLWKNICKKYLGIKTYVRVERGSLYSTFLRTKGKVNENFRDFYHPAVAMTFLNTLTSSEWTYHQKLAELMIEFPCNDSLRILWNIQMKISTLIINHSFSQMIDCICEHAATFEEFVLMSQSEPKFEVIGQRIMNYYELIYVNYNLIPDTLKPPKHKMKQLEKFLNQVKIIPDFFWKVPRANVYTDMVIKEIHSTELSHLLSNQQANYNCLVLILEIYQEKSLPITDDTKQTIQFSLENTLRFNDLQHFAIEKVKKLNSKRYPAHKQYLAFLRVYLIYLLSLKPICCEYFPHVNDLESLIDQLLIPIQNQYDLRHQELYHNSSVPFQTPFVRMPTKRVCRYSLIFRDLAKKLPNLITSNQVTSICGELVEDFSGIDNAKTQFTTFRFFPFFSDYRKDVPILKTSHTFWLLDACYSNNYLFVEHCLKNSLVPVNFTGYYYPVPNENSPLFDAFFKKNSVRYYQGTTMLFIASACGHENLVKLLIKFNADPSLPRYDGLTARAAALSQNHKKIVEMLEKYEEVLQNNPIFKVGREVPWKVKYGEEIQEF